MKSEMTKPELRIAVAQDVLKSLRRLDVRMGVFVEQTHMADRKVDKILSGDDVKVIAQKLKTKCKVCVLGACLMSVVSIDNNFAFHSRIDGVTFGVGSYDVAERLLKLFTAKQLLLIETAFEVDLSDDMEYGYFTDKYTLLNMSDEEFAQTAKHRKVAAAFGRQFDTPKDRLRAIMKNMIENGGKFVPPKVSR